MGWDDFSSASCISIFLRGSRLDCSTSRREFEQRHQARGWSGLARFGPTTPTRARTSLIASVDPTDAPKDAGHAHAEGGIELRGLNRLKKIEPTAASSITDANEAP